MLSRIAIVNRGEAAMRLIHAVRELNGEGPFGIRSIALHTPAERRSQFVREADEAVPIGAPGRPDGARGGNPYLDHGELERALRAGRADAAWVGWGFVAEDPAFAELCERIGVVFIGPSAQTMRMLGDKIGAKLLAERAGVPVAAWSRGPVETLAEVRRWAGEIGFPLMIKATAGGGGRGIRIVGSQAGLASAFESARSEALKAFGDGTVFIERLVTGAHHVEVQVIADGRGTVWAVGVRDCSLQRRNQKVIEESSSTALDADHERQLREAATRLAAAAGYRGAGTVEFLYQPAERAFAFLEVNTRLQVEHPVTEATTGLDLVKLQIQVAAGGRLEGAPPVPRGHAIEARLNAEDPDRGFAPAPGTVEKLELPGGPGVRVDTGIAEGDLIPPEYDSMIAKVIAWGRDRNEARGRLERALAETRVVIRGGTTNKSFLLRVLGHPEVAAGAVDTAWLDRLTAGEATATPPHAEIALLAAAIDAYDAAVAIDRARFLAAGARGRPEASAEVGYPVELRYRGHGYRLEVALVGPDGRYLVEVEGRSIPVHVERLRPHESRLRTGRQAYRVVSVTQAADHLVEVDGVMHRASRDEGGLVRAPAPALVVAIPVAAGDVVEAGAPLAVLESMKMETVLGAPFAGRVREVLAAGNVQVDAGAPLLRLEPLAEAAAAGDQPRVSFSQPPAGVEDGAGGGRRELLEALRCLLLGYDLRPERARGLVQDYRRQPAAGGLGTFDAELRILDIFSDLSVLSRNRRVGDQDGEESASSREHLNSYLRSLDADREGLPASFQDRLRRVLAHYGVAGLERTPALEESVYRTFLAQRRLPSQVPVVLAVLDRLPEPDAVGEAGRERLRAALDRLIAATQLRHPLVGEAARSLRFRGFDRPLIEHAREQVYAAMRDHLDHLDAHPDAPDVAERMEALVSCPQPIVRLLAERAQKNDPDPREPMLEALTRRYYKIRRLQGLRSFVLEGRQVVTAHYEHEGRRLHVVAVRAELSSLAVATGGVAGLTRDVAAPDEVVVDLYVRGVEAAADTESLAAAVGDLINSAGLPAAVRRVAVVASGRDRAGAGGSEVGVDHFTFRRAGGGFSEDPVVRGMHPMIARRLHLWRLSRFRITRLMAPEDVHLFHCVAPDNPADQRLMARGEVRDLTPLRDLAGRVSELPELERVLASCLDAIRSARAGRPTDSRLELNRVFLYVWPPLAGMPLEDLLPLARSLAPMTEGLGLEEVSIQGRTRQPDGELKEVVLRLTSQPGAGFTMHLDDPRGEPLQPLDAYRQKTLAAHRRGAVYPYELIPLITRSAAASPGVPAAGSFTEHDLDPAGRLLPVARPYGRNSAGIVVGVVRTPTFRYPEGMARLALFGDPTKGLGSLAEAECRRVLAALDLATEIKVPVEWFALSSGARVSMESGTENMDWVARVLRRLVGFTQAGGEVNVVVTGINVGAQPYWNAEATMLMHTRGILVMTPDSAMVLTGKQALDYSGGVSAEDNLGIGGYERVMGPNGQAQYLAPDLAGACELLLAHYEHTYVAPGERFPRRAATDDPTDRDVCREPHRAPGSEFRLIGEIFSERTNPGRKKPFDIRTLMRATADRDHPPLERWAGMRDAENVVVLDVRLGGHAVAMVGIESRPLLRHGLIPADGPDQWTAGTLFPLSSKKMARAINAASGNRPLVVLANLSGFDGSPESLRKLQLEYGAEIGRAVVNFDGPIVFCVVSRYHGGAFVVFSKTLNGGMEVAAVEGSHASVIGGAPAAAVVFAAEVSQRVGQDPRVRELEGRAGKSAAAGAAAEIAEVTAAVRAEKLGEVAAEFDEIHSVERAVRVGSVDRVIPAQRLRPYLIEAVERGMRRYLK